MNDAPENIVPFPAAQGEPRIWVCECGCSSFELLENSSTRCALCGCDTPDDGGWFTPERDQDWRGDPPVREVSSNGEEGFARNYILNRGRREDAVFVSVLLKDGTISIWTNVETAKQRSWVMRQLKAVRGLLKDRK